ASGKGRQAGVTADGGSPRVRRDAERQAALCQRVRRLACTLRELVEEQVKVPKCASAYVPVGLLALQREVGQVDQQSLHDLSGRKPPVDAQRRRGVCYSCPLLHAACLLAQTVCDAPDGSGAAELPARSPIPRASGQIRGGGSDLFFVGLLFVLGGAPR